MADLKDKFKNIKDKAEGKIHEVIGEITDDDSHELKGKLQQKKADLKEDFEELKDKVSDKINDILDRDDEK